MNSMLTRIIVTVLPLVAFGPDAADPNANRVAVVTQTPGCVAFWDFVKREPDGAHRYTAHVPEGAKTDYPLDAANYIKDYWGAGREATYADFPLLRRGPFGNAVRIVNETDPEFRPFLFVPRARLHDSPLDIKGAGKSVTVVVWAIRESGNHALAGIWHEGTDLKQKETAAIQAECVPLAEAWHTAFRPGKMAATPRESAGEADAGELNGKMDGRKSLEWFQAQRIRELSGYWRGSYRAGVAEDNSLLIRAEPSSMDGALRSIPHSTSFTSTALVLVHKDHPPCPKTASPRVAGFCKVLPPSARPAS